MAKEINEPLRIVSILLLENMLLVPGFLLLLLWAVVSQASQSGCNLQRD